MSIDAYPAPSGIRYIQYDSAKEKEYVAAIRQLISKDLSEPYSIYVYRYFLYQWGDLCYMVRSISIHLEGGTDLLKAMDEKDTLAGVVVSKLEPHRAGPMRGYIAMLATKEEHRGKGIAKHLVRMAIDAMIERDADEVNLTSGVVQFPRRQRLTSRRLHSRRKKLTKRPCVCTRVLASSGVKNCIGII